MKTEVQTRKSPATIHSLFEGIVDYAGLFPPATLPLTKAVQNYGAYRSGGNAWMLGRFVIPASRLPELAAILPDAAKNGPPWRISALVGNDFESDLEQIAKFNRSLSGYRLVDSIEMAVELHNRIEELVGKLPPALSAYFEVPLDSSFDLLRAIARSGVRAKARTGGVKPEAIPRTSDLAAFVVNCARAFLPFKATAGLHHPIRSMRPLAYEPNAVKGEMHGFLNLLFAAAFAMSGMAVVEIAGVLADEDSSSFRLTDSEVQWKQRTLPASLLRETRERLFTSFGSCSFQEPVEDLASLGWL